MQWVRRLTPLGHKIRQAFQEEQRRRMAFSWSKFGDIAKLITPLIINIVAPGLGAIGTAIADGISAAEQIKGATGQQKLASVQQIATDAASAVNAAHGTQVIDPTTLNTAVTSAVNTSVAVINLLQPKAVTPVVSTVITPKS